jgi:hypothetical protein
VHLIKIYCKDICKCNNVSPMQLLYAKNQWNYTVMHYLIMVSSEKCIIRQFCYRKCNREIRYKQDIQGSCQLNTAPWLLVNGSFLVGVHCKTKRATEYSKHINQCHGHCDHYQVLCAVGNDMCFTFLWLASQ